MVEIIADRLSKADWNPCRARIHSFMAVVLFIWLVVLLLRGISKIKFLDYIGPNLAAAANRWLLQ
jgi:hypothetical protein